MKSFRPLAIALALSLIATVTGCASSSNPKAQSGENLRLTHKGGAPNSRLSVLRSEARWYAFLYCQKQSKNVHVIAFEDAQGPYFIGNFPATDIIFSCEA